MLNRLGFPSFRLGKNRFAFLQAKGSENHMLYRMFRTETAFAAWAAKGAHAFVNAAKAVAGGIILRTCTGL